MLSELFVVLDDQQTTTRRMIAAARCERDEGNHCVGWLGCFIDVRHDAFAVGSSSSGCADHPGTPQVGPFGAWGRPECKRGAPN